MSSKVLKLSSRERTKQRQTKTQKKATNKKKKIPNQPNRPQQNTQAAQATKKPENHEDGPKTNHRKGHLLKGLPTPSKRTTHHKDNRCTKTKHTKAKQATTYTTTTTTSKQDSHKNDSLSLWIDTYSS